MWKILVVEDEKSLRALYKADLEAEGHRVDTAADAQEAFDAIDHEVPDLVVLDVRLPRADGLEVMGKILAEHPQVPIVLNTAYSSYRDNFLSWAADAYLVKSSDTTELCAKVHELLERHPVAATR